VLPEVHQEVTGRLGCPWAVRIGGDTGEVDTPGAVLDDDQGVDAPQEHGVHVNEIGREDAASLSSQELLAGRAEPRHR
jgi:hypothetical protein